MKIVFICGSVENGKDGVGDYTRQLAYKLISAGHIIAIIAINDTYVESISKSTDGTNGLNLLRIPSNLSWTNRAELVEKIIDEVNPNWVSLQYVPFSFNKRGFAYKMLWALKDIHRNIKWTIMFHETWVGITRLSPVKHKITGLIQKLIAISIVKSLKPIKVSTTNRLYQLVLQDANISSSIIPLFSNIPVCSADLLFNRLIYRKIGIDSEKLGDVIMIGIFGSLYEDANLEGLIESEISNARDAQKQVVFISFGRVGNVTEFERLRMLYGSDVKFLMLGEISESEVSTVFQILNKGISCTPFEHIGKSGVYAAMRLHGLETLIPSSDPIPEYVEEIRVYNDYLNSRIPSDWSVDYVANKYVEFLDS